MWLNRISHLYRFQKGAMRRRTLNLSSEIRQVTPDHMVFAEDPEKPLAHTGQVIEALFLELDKELQKHGGEHSPLSPA